MSLYSKCSKCGLTKVIDVNQYAEPTFIEPMHCRCVQYFENRAKVKAKVIEATGRKK